MSVEEQVREYMRGYCDGVIYQHVPDRNNGASVAYHRGFTSGRAAYLAAEQAERERLESGLEPCPKCKGTGKAHPKLHLACLDCHGTGKRREA